MEQLETTCYPNDLELTMAVSEFIGDGIEIGDAGLIVAAQQHRSDVRQRLQLRASCDQAMRADPGVFRSLDASGVLADFMNERWPDTQRFVAFFGNAIDTASHDGKRPVRVYCEMATVLTEARKDDAAARLEQLWNSLIALRSFSLLRAYRTESEAGSSRVTLVRWGEQLGVRAPGHVHPDLAGYVDSSIGQTRFKPTAA